MLIPFRDRWDMTNRFLSYLQWQLIGPQVKIRTVLIINHSQDSCTANLIEAARQAYPLLNINTINADYEFNYSRINNDGFRKFATHETKWVLCLNNDVEFLDQSIVQRMIQTIDSLPQVGVVGCSLVYPNRRSPQGGSIHRRRGQSDLVSLGISSGLAYSLRQVIYPNLQPVVYSLVTLKMPSFVSFLLGNTVRALGKAYEFFLILYAWFVRAPGSDPSAILVELYTRAQSKAQIDIDQLSAKPDIHGGEILVLIPFRDRWDLTAVCLKTLSEQKLVKSILIRVVLIDNGSILADTAAGIQEALRKYPGLQVETLRADYKFNYSQLNNDGFRQFKSNQTKWVLFLNNDVELRDDSIVERMCSYLDNLPESGAVGCTLLYPDRRIQHIFAAPGVKIIAAHPLRRAYCNPSMEWFAKPARPVAAVTGAVMMVRADDFAQIGMFDEDLPTLGQDIVLCLMLREKLGKYSVAVSSGNVIHHEGLTKPPSFDVKEINYIYKKYGDLLRSDLFLNGRLSRWSERPLIGMPFEPPYPVKTVVRSWQ